MLTSKLAWFACLANLVELPKATYHFIYDVVFFFLRHVVTTDFTEFGLLSDC